MALLMGEERERASAMAAFARLSGAFAVWMGHHARIIRLTNANSYLTPVIPAVLAAPKFLASELTVG